MAKDTTTPSRDMPDLERTASLLNSGAIHLLRGLRETDRLAGLTPARLSALSVLVFGGACPLGRLAKAEGVTSPTMTRIVDGLCELGLAERQSHPDHAGISVIAATTQGEELMKEAAERRFAAIAAAMQQLPVEDRAMLMAAAPALRRLAAILREDALRDSTT